MRCSSGFTLIETLFSALILVTGLTAIAAAFSYGVTTSIRVRQQTTAFTLLTEKMEELKAQPRLQTGRYVEYVGVPRTYQRVWEISSESPQRVTVIVAGHQPGPGNIYQELARASTFIGPGF